MLVKVTLAATVLTASLACGGGAVAQPVTGLYVGAIGGGNFMQREQIRVRPAPGVPALSGRAGFETGYVGAGAIGWGFGNGFRLEVEGNYRRNDIGNRQTGLAISGRETKYGGMANVLFDLDIGSPYVYPYIGVGGGYALVDQQARIATGPFSASLDSKKGGFAYQAVAGVSLPIPPVVGLSLLAEYRYFAVAGERQYEARVVGPSAPAFAQIKEKGDFNHSLTIGLRYAFNVAPPPVEPRADVSPPPIRENGHNYIVFFDWDRVDLSVRARQVVAEAAQAATRVQVTRIEVAGHTDASGSSSYNNNLSVRRAQMVANELVRDGVPKQAISIQGFGQTRLLVPTADGVREPQNRRVEIVMR